MNAMGDVRCSARLDLTESGSTRVTMPISHQEYRDFPVLAAQSVFDYILCGWKTHSSIALTGVTTTVAVETPDITIHMASGPSPISRGANGFSTKGVILDHSTERSLIGVRDIADFEISEGKEIRIWPSAAKAHKDIEIFLLGLVWGTLCHQRGTFPLHASAISTPGGITAFAGHSGSGKSTTAALMDSLGFGLIADDILPVSFYQGSLPGAWPYLRRLKLQRDAILEFSLVPKESVGEELDKEKFFVGSQQNVKDEWRRLERLYVLEIDPTVSTARIDRINGAEAIRVLIDQTYHYRFVVGCSKFREHLESCVQLASKLPIYRLRRAPSHVLSRELGSLICEHLKEVSKSRERAALN